MDPLPYPGWRFLFLDAFLYRLRILARRLRTVSRPRFDLLFCVIHYAITS